jgi:hypothetical protein
MVTSLHLPQGGNIGSMKGGEKRVPADCSPSGDKPVRTRLQRIGDVLRVAAPGLAAVYYAAHLAWAVKQWWV